jgi:hypothetical protein
MYSHPGMLDDNLLYHTILLLIARSKVNAYLLKLEVAYSHYHDVTRQSAVHKELPINSSMVIRRRAAKTEGRQCQQIPNTTFEMTLLEDTFFLLENQ